MPSSTRRSSPVADRAEAGLLDTSVVIALPLIDPELLPRTVGISSVTLAELAAGPAATEDAHERARRQDRLQRVEATFDPMPFDGEAARAYGRVYAAVVAHGRKPRRRPADLQIAAVGLANGLAVVTRNGDDFEGLHGLVDVLVV